MAYSLVLLLMSNPTWLREALLAFRGPWIDRWQAKTGRCECPIWVESGRFGLPLAPLDTCMRRFDLSRPNPAVRYNPLAIDTLSVNRVVSQNALA